MLPDDDYLLSSTADSAFRAVAADPSALDCGFAAFGWYYLKDERFLASHMKQRGLHGALHYAPKFATTLFNMKRFHAVGGFDGTVGGFCDTALFGRLAFEYDALIGDTPIGIYRLHDGQESARLRKVYAPYVETLIQLLGRYARDERERLDFERELFEYAHGSGRIGGVRAIVQDILFPLRSRKRPIDAPTKVAVERWSGSPTK
jgi:hypothetical protein